MKTMVLSSPAYCRRQAFDAFRNQIDNFSRAIRGHEPLVITPTDALASVEVIEAAYAALRRSQWMPVKTTDGGGAADGVRIVRCARTVT